MTKNKTTSPPKLADLDMDKRLSSEESEPKIAAIQEQFQKIQQAYLRDGATGVVVMEGWDAAGKGGTIRRMSAVMDPRGFRVWPIAAPEPRDLKRHYLARFWERLPEKGEICVFDRSWYGRVLVERVEGFATKEEWKRAYREIAEFEKLLTDAGARMAKIFLAITPDEQMKRFEKRLNDPLKRWKLSYEDFRNRERWDDYEAAADEMLEKTHTANAPWLVIPANSKNYARVTALSAIADRLSEGLDLSPRPRDEELVERFEKLKEKERRSD